MRTLIAKEVAALCVARFMELGAARGESGCYLDYGDGGRCAIGLSLNEEEMRKVMILGINGHGVGALLANNIVSGDSDTDCTNELRLKTIQVAHDKCVSDGLWCDLNRAVMPPPVAEFMKEQGHAPVSLPSLKKFYELCAEHL